MTAAGPSRRLAWTLAFAAGVIVTIEFSVAGLLPGLARDLGVSLAGAGRLASAFALASAVAGPPLTLWAARAPTRVVLVGSLALFGVSNLIAVAAPSYPLVLVVRLAQGAALPVIISLAISALLRAAPGRPQGQSLSALNAGVVLGAVVALPAAVALAGRLDWRASFAGLGALALLAAVAVAGVVRPTSGQAPPSAASQAKLFARPAAAGHLALSALAFTGLFCSYTYASAYLEAVAGLAPLAVGLALGAFGLAGLLGNALAGRLVDRAPTLVTGLAMLLFAAVMAALAATDGRLTPLAPLILAWGGLHAGLFVICQSRVLHAAPDAPAFASSLNIAACNLGIALGATLGGWVVDQAGLRAIGWGAAGVGLIAGLAALAGTVSPRRLRLPRSP